jgi:glycosyltransferase involved in cell wall biosynthesis
MPELHVPRAANVAKTQHPLKIAIVYGRPPIPMTRADQKTVAHLIEFLAARGHEIDFYSLAGEEPVTDTARQWLSDRCRTISITWKSKARSIFDGALAALRAWPLQIGYFWSRQQARALADGIKKRDYDLIYVYYIRSAPVFQRALELAGKTSFSGASFLGMQLSQALNTRRMVESMRRRSDRAIYSIESRHLRRFEAQVWRHFDRVVLIGAKDLEELRQVCRETGQREPDNVFLCAHGVDIEEFKPDWGGSEDGKTLVFSGVMRTNTNIHAITWFAREVWPRIREAEPAAQLFVVGRQPSAEVRMLGGLPGVTVTGEVASTADYIRKASVCINPMQVGAGMQNKLLEFLAMGKATVATTLANEGIGAAPDRDLLVADAPDAFAERVLQLLRDPARRAALGRSARAFVESEWSWEAQFLLLEGEFHRAVDEARAAGRHWKPTAARQGAPESGS